MQKLIFSLLLILSLSFVGCEPYDDTYSKNQKEIEAQIDAEKLVFDEYVVDSVYNNTKYKVADILEDSLEIGYILLKRTLGEGKAILPGDQVGISYTYRELRRNSISQKPFEFIPYTTIVVPDSADTEQSPHNNWEDNDPYMVSATTSIYTTKSSGSGVSTVIGHAIELMREGDEGTLIMSYISHGLPIPNYRSIVLDFEITYVQKQ